VGATHGRVKPDNILLLPDDRPLLLGPGAVAAALDADRREPGLHAPDLGFERDPADDVHQLARVACFCITGHGSPERGRADDEPLRAALERMQLGGYDPALLDALEAAASPDPERRPRSIDAFREWLVLGPPHLRAAAVAAAVADAAAAADAASATPDVPVEHIDEPSIDPATHASLFHEAAFAAPGFDGSASRDAHADTEPLIVDSDVQAADTQPLHEDTRPWFGDSQPGTAPTAETMPGAAVARGRGRMRAWLLPGVVLSLVLAAAVAWVVSQQPVRVEGWTREQVSPLVPDLTPRDRGAAARPDATPLAPPTPMAEAPPRVEPTPPVPTSTDPVADSPPLASTASRLKEEAAEPAEPTAPSDAKANTTIAVPSHPKPPTRTATSHATEPHGNPARAATAPATTARATSTTKGNPADACSGRTPFARYRCIETQCAQARWSGHAQCVRFRRTGEVD
jgi:hypothetical protein